MRKACRYFSWIFSTIVCLSITSAQASEWTDKAEAEGKLTWYASLGATDARRIFVVGFGLFGEDYSVL